MKKHTKHYKTKCDICGSPRPRPESSLKPRLSMKLLLKVAADFMHKHPEQDMKPIVDFIDAVERQMKSPTTF